MPKKYALLIAVENYQDAAISRVQFATADATELAASLKVLGFIEQSILVDKLATKTVIESRIKKWINRLSADDTFYLFYAGHGFSQNGRNYITCFDTIFDDLRDTSISLQFIFELLRKSPCRRKVMFLDACESGMQIDKSMRAILGDLDDNELRNFFESAEFCVCFASCKTDEPSWPDSTLKHGIWTHFLIQALSANDKRAVERKRYITASSLQSYLADEVPRALRKRRPMETQTPWMCGSLSKEFVIADVGDILAERRKPSPFTPEQLKQVLFRAAERGSIKKLSGFRKGVHKLPDSVNDRAASFVANIANAELDIELVSMFDKIKIAFDYTRRDISKIDPVDGVGAIETPDFHYTVSVTQDPNDAVGYELTRMITNIKNLDIVESDAFNDLFFDMFSVLEFEFKSSIAVKDWIDDLEESGFRPNYDPRYTYCEFSFQNFDASIVITSHSVRFVHSQPEPPRQLVASLAQYRALVAKNDIKMLPLS